jgi:2',3'-cyclic-nucleotide 2'-phosphodiesterase (5'-nucleotidase family)
MSKLFQLVIVMITINFLFTSGRVAAQTPYTAGNLVVLRVGEGLSALTNASTALFLDEIAPTGSFIQTHAVPTSGTHVLTSSGSASSEGQITRTPDGQYLILAGYNADPGTASIVSTTAASVNRKILQVNNSNNYTPLLSSAAYSANNIRSAAANGNDYWAAGTGSTAGTNGIQYFGNSAACQVSATITNTRVVNVYNGQLYFSTGSNPIGIYSVGSGLPTTTGQTSSLVIAGTGASPSPYAFSFNTASTICYVADDRTAANGGGIQKFAFNGSSWSLIYTLNVGTTGARGLTIDWSGNHPVIYATTTESSANRLVKITDSVSGAPFTLLATAATFTAFRGIAFAPVTQVAPDVVTMGATNVGSATATLNGTVDANNLSGTVSFEYGMTDSYGTTVPGVPAIVNGDNATPVSAALTGLIQNTTYHYRVIGTSVAGTSYGMDSTFTTTTCNSYSTTLANAYSSYTWNGTTYTAPGTYTFMTTNAAGCDSVATLVLDFINFPLQILHASDFEASTDAVQDAPRFAAIVDSLENVYPNSVTLSSGDNFIPSPFSFSGEDPRMVLPYRTSYASYYNATLNNPPYDLRAGIGRADISIMNYIGVEASTLGNHDFDFGTPELRNIIGGNISGSNVRWFGAQFPYLSSNLNFTGDPNMSPVFTPVRQLNTAYGCTPANTPAQIAAKKKLAPYCYLNENGEKIGVVGVTTPMLASISSPGTTSVKNPGAGTNDMTLLATIVQPYIDSLINQEGCNKVILLSHLQQLAFEKELATKLHGVDIIIAGGSHTLMADNTDRLRSGDVAMENYPYLTAGSDGKPTAIINTDGNYKYVGRLVVEFTPAGEIIPSSINPAISGAYATDAQGLQDVWGANAALALAPGTRGYQVKLLCDSIGSAILAKDGNLFGKTSVFLEGRRNFVRTEETNLGNISAEANLWMAKFYDSTTVISIKNGGGIRSIIGFIQAWGDSVVYYPPQANPAAGKQEGDISQLDIENSLRFNNLLSLLTVDAAGLRRTLEHGVSATAPGATPGQFPQVSGVRFSFDPTLPVFNPGTGTGGRIVNAVITNDSGTIIIDTLIMNGALYGNPARTFRLVTLNFLAGGGDSYPFPIVGSNRIDINTVPVPPLVPGVASFTLAGSEQDAFAEYTKTLHSAIPYHRTDTPVTQDYRIQNLTLRSDSVFPVIPVSSMVSDTVSTGQSKCFNATQTITVGGPSGDFLIENGGSSTMIAGINIVYLPGTVVKEGGYMLGNIAPNGPWCISTPMALPVSAVKTGILTSTEMDNSQNFIIYPNPTQGKFMIEPRGNVSYKNIRVDIYNMLGNHVYSSQTDGLHMINCNLDGNSPGLYHIRINSDGKVTILKLILSR